jgi:hypothetical protein
VVYIFALEMELALLRHPFLAEKNTHHPALADDSDVVTKKER